MTKREAVRLCKKYWREIVASGQSKSTFLRNNLDHPIQDLIGACPLCAYASPKDSCTACPLWLQYGKPCFDLGYQSKRIYKLDDPWVQLILGLKE